MTYALAFDLDTDVLKQTYPVPSWQNAYGDIRKTLAALGFQWQQGSVYFGDEKVNAVTCVVAAQKLSNTYIWFKPAVRDFRMLRIEEMNDLSAAI
jgi:virulence-associated protein VapD